MIVRGYDWDELSLEELGELHGISTTTAWRRLERGQALLGHRLKCVL